MNTRVKFIKTDNGIVSIQTTFPTINGVEQPMEMVIAIEREGKDIVFNIKKEQAKTLLKEMKRAVGLVDFMG
jgi:hypothetical protein